MFVNFTLLLPAVCLKKRNALTLNVAHMCDNVSQYEGVQLLNGLLLTLPKLKYTLTVKNMQYLDHISSSGSGH